MALRLRLFFLLILFPATLFSWTLEAEKALGKAATELAPVDLRYLISRHRDEFERGIEDAARDESGARATEHRHFAGGTLTERIRREADRSVAIVANREGFERLVYHLGVLAHLIADANNPFHVENRDSRMAAVQRDYEAYLTRRMRRFRLVFYGVQRPASLEAMIGDALRRSSSYYFLLAEEYHRGGARRSSAEFDDRSTAFGVASLSWSHAMTDIVNAFNDVWQRSGGKPLPSADTGKGPALKGGKFIHE